MSWFNKLKSGLSRTSASIASVFATNNKLDANAINELEEILLSTDMGVLATNSIIDHIKKQQTLEVSNMEQVKIAVRDHIAEILQPISKQLVIKTENRPFVIMICGVNGNGKTTTVGKLAARIQQQGYSIMLAACDTFRAAAIQQLETWAKYSDAGIVIGADNSDPASVAYRAYTEAKATSTDVLLIDTAGRLHNNSDLMAELQKCVRTIQKIDPSAPHETILVLDGTTGQNAHNQIKGFGEAIKLTGLIITKLDSTAKGGIVVGIAKQHNLPLYAIGVGESVEDLNSFSPKDFADAILS